MTDAPAGGEPTAVTGAPTSHRLSSWTHAVVRLAHRLLEIVDGYAPATLRADAAMLMRARLLLLYSATVLAICPLFVGLVLRHGRTDLAAVTGGAMLVGSLTGPVLRRTSSIAWASTLAITTYGATHGTLFLLAGYFDLSSFYWLMSTPMFATFLRGIRGGAITMAVVTVAVVVASLFYCPPVSAALLASGADPLGDSVGAFVFGVILFSFSCFYDLVRHDSMTSLRAALRATEQARARAEESGAARSRLVASITHELRTPLNGVVGLVHLVEKTPLSPEQRELTTLMGESADATVALLNDLLEFARLDVGHVTVAQMPLDVRRVVRGVVRLFDERAAAQHTALEVRIDDAVPPRVVGDARRLRQILWNLIGNAVKFTTDGTVSVVVDVVDAGAHPVVLRFSVVDTGPGIDEATRQRLFQPFEQGSSDMHRRLGGTGLGLAISRNLVVVLGGTGIDLDTRVGEGSRFAFALPFRRPSAAELESRAPGRVLLVEDDPVSALVAARMVEAAGLRCDVVGDGDTAIASLAHERYDLVLMDGNLPGCDGFDATRAIRRAEGEGRHVPIVALTASQEDDGRARALAAGMDDLLAKPLDPERLHAVLEVHLRRAG